MRSTGAGTGDGAWSVGRGLAGGKGCAEDLPGLMLERKLKLQLCNPNSYLKKRSQNLYFYLKMFKGL